MKQFIAGFIVASILWLGILYAQSSGLLQLFAAEESVETNSVEGESEAKDSSSKKQPRKRRSKKRQGPAGNKGVVPAYETGEGQVGDKLGSAPGQNLDMAAGGGEDQLSSAEIEAGIDQVFSGIQRCLVLVPSNAPAVGKLVLGMQIAPGGKVTKVNLKGPNTLIKGEAGACFQRTAKSIHYRSFDGPQMTVHYPITFE